MKYGLVLSGGGFKGAIQLGALEELTRDHYNQKGEVIFKGRKYDVVSGISVGALNAAFVDDIPALRELWLSVKDSQGGVITNGNLGEIQGGKLKIRFDKVFKTVTKDVGVFDGIKALFGKKGKANLGTEVSQNLSEIDSILDNTPLANLLNKHIDIAKLRYKLKFGGVSLETGQAIKFSHFDFYNNAELAKAILSSATMPVIWPPVRIVRTKFGVFNHLVDGGIRVISPIGMIFDEMEDGEEWTIDVLHCNSRGLPTLMDVNWNIANTGGRTIDMLLNQNFVNDLDTSLYLNENAEYLNLNPLRTKKIRQATINIFEPKVGDAGGTLDATPEMIDYRIELGRNLALKYIKNYGG